MAVSMTADASPVAPPLSPLLERYFQIAIYLMVAMGFVTVAATGELNAIPVIFVSAGLLFRGYLLARQRTTVIPEAWSNFLTLGYAAFYLLDYLFISRAFLNATVHLVLFAMVVRLFSARRDRDYYFLAIIAFLMVLVSSVLTVNSIFVAAFAGFMLMAVATFILMEMRHAARKAGACAGEKMDERTSRRIVLSLAGAVPLIVVLILAGAGGIFFVLPRISAGYFSAYSPSNELATGFTDRVQLGQIGEIQQSSAVAMHIQIDGDSNGDYDLKWRGVTLNVFDGRVWSNPHEQHVITRQPDGSFDLETEGRARRGENAGSRAQRIIQYRVLMEPVATNVFFLAATPEVLEGSYHLVSMDNGGAVFNLDSAIPISRYEATSNIARPEAEQLRGAEGSYPPEIASSYLQLPALDARIPALAAQITAAAPTNYDKAAALEAYLRTHFGYTLQLSRSRTRDPLAEFLFTRRQGHCEYFASAMAVMLRTLHIPSRLVNGFRTGEFNDLTSQYVIRASDAHSWVEAYFPEYGWVSFDPTPAGAAPRRTRWKRMMLYVDAAQSFWREWIVNYDVRHQQTLGESAVHSGHDWWRKTRRWAGMRYERWLDSARHVQAAVGERPRGWGLALAVGLVLLALLLNARRIQQTVRRRRIAGRPQNAPQLAATIWYGRVTRTVARRGWRRTPELTPREFVASIHDAAVRAPMGRFARHYERARFGGSAEDAQLLPELYDEIRAAVRR